MDGDGDDAPSSFDRRVGERMRAIRRQRGLSLHDVERVSADEFKASVVGAYERGERSISVPRLERLAAVYQVPVEHLLPRGDTGRDASPSAGPSYSLAIDMVRLCELPGEAAQSLARYVRSIQVQRTEVATRAVRLRGDDTRAVAAILDSPVDQVADRLDALGVLVRS